MKLRKGLEMNLALAGASVLATLVVFALGYEAVASVRYYRWRASFDNNERQRRNLLRIEFHRYHFAKHRDEVFRALEQMLEQMRDVLASHDASLLLAVAPVFPDKPGDPDYFGSPCPP